MKISEFLNIYWLGARVWIWLLVLIGVVVLGCVVIWWYREAIKKKWYELRLPEKLMKVVIHYDSGMFKEYWRLLPDDKFFRIGKQQYEYDQKGVIKDNDFFAHKKKLKDKLREEYEIIIDGKKYNVDQLCSIKTRWKRYPEIHFYYNVPYAIHFKVKEGKLDFTSTELETFKENDLVMKLFKLAKESAFLFYILIGVFLILIITGVNLANTMGWLK